MTILDFQEALMKDIERTLKGIRTKDISGKTVEGVNVYAQDLPIILACEDDESKFFPYAIVRLYDGITEDDESPWTVTADIHFGIYDADEDNQGHKHVITMIQRVADRFAHEPLLDRRYRAQRSKNRKERPISWQIKLKWLMNPQWKQKRQQSKQQIEHLTKLQ